MVNKRRSGVLLHPVSLPGRYGIGDLGKSCKDFIDFLVKAEQKLWQILPLGHTGFGDSPYQSFSTFAGNPLLISPETLVCKGYISQDELNGIPLFPMHSIDYGSVVEFKISLLKKAYDGFKEKSDRKLKTKFTQFCNKNKEWLDDYALFISIKNYYIEERKMKFEPKELKAYRRTNLKTMGENGVLDCFYGACFNSWEKDISMHEPEAVKKWTKKLAKEVEFYKFCQFEFFEQWAEIKEYANENGIKIIGDIPIFVAADSADVWSRRELFKMNAKGYPKEVAGVPPDYFSETGQLWGNPLYDWEYHKETGYEWWVKRIKAMFNIVDILRIDHFRAFESYWAIPYGSETAVNGKWKKGPNRELFDKVREQLGDLPIIAEDLGILNDEVHKLRNDLGFPGMKILQFAFGDTPKNEYLPHNYIDSNCIVYTGTHDNDTTLGWYNSMDMKTKDYFRRYLNISGEDAAWDMIRLAFMSSANTAIIPMQDLLNLGTEARMNTPGVSDGNWQFRYSEDMLTNEVAEGLAYLTKLYNR